MSQSESASHTNDDHEVDVEVDIDQEIEDAIKELPLSEKIRAAAINTHLNEKKALDEELQKKIASLTLEYEQKSLPLYTQSQELIAGRAPTDEEIKDLNKYLKEGEAEQVATAQTTSAPLADYWFKALQTHQDIVHEIKEADEPVLKSLLKIEYIPVDLKKFEIVFTFAPNDYFANTELRKVVNLNDDEEPVSTTGTPIEWKEGKNTTIKITKKTQKNKKTGVKRVVEKETKIESFFNFFSDSAATEHPEEEEEDRDENAMDGDRLNIDYDIARSIVDEIIPYSLEYFLGIRTGGDDEDFDEDDMEDMDEEEVEELKKQYEQQTGGKKGKGGNAPAAGGANDKKECKQ